MKRIFWIVLDSAGIGEAPDADKFGDVGSNTWKSCYDSGKLHIPNMEKIGIYQIDGMEYAKSTENPTGSFAKMQELSCGKDTTTGHWEMAGIVTPDPLPKFPDGFPKVFIEEFSKRTGRKILCNLPYSGTQVIHDYGREQEETGALIVYTSADSVCQIAAHEEIIPVEQLYEYCKIAREMLTGDLGVGRVIARPFIGTWPNYERTIRRHDFSLAPPRQTVLDALKAEGKDVIGVGKIYDIFAVRIKVETVRDCYSALGIIHEMYKPIPGRFKDYIAMPKSNMYQSLHTTLIGPEGQPIEIQIRTFEMHRTAEYGIAAHWKYKENITGTVMQKEEEKLSWLRQILEWQRDTSDNKEFMNFVKTDLDLFAEQV